MNINVVTSFFEQVKQEVKKISWPSKKETMTATYTVLIMVVVAGLFFLLIDMGVHKLVQFLLKLGS